MQIYGILLRFRGIFTKMRGKSRKMHGKSGNFRGIHSSKWQNRREILRSFPVVFGRNPVIFPVIPGHFPIDSD